MDTITATLTLWISAYGGWDWTRTKGSMTKVVFSGPNADDVAADWWARRVGVRYDEAGQVTSWGLVVEPDEATDWDAFPKVLALLNPTCEHGLSANLCAGPGHYPIDL